MDEQAKLSLQRDVGLLGAVSLIGGTMIGSGIFMSPQTVVVAMGSPGASLLVWAGCGLLVILAAFCYAELGTVIKESGGEYIYILQTSGPVPAFMLAFSSVLFVRPAGLAGISLSFAQYAVVPFYLDCPPPELVVKSVAAVSIIVLAIVNCMNVRFAMSVQVFFMVSKVVALGIIIIGGVVVLATGNNESFQESFENTNVGINPIGVAFYQGLWSYDGWNNLNYVTEELKRPEVNLPRALMIAIFLVTGLYLLVNVSYFAVLTPKELMSSTAVAVTWGNKVLGSWGWIMSVAAALSAFGSLNGTFFSGGRLCYVAAREGHMPDILSMAHVHRLTPSPALIFTTAVSLIVLMMGDFQSIVNYFSFTAWFFYGITLGGLIYLKIKKPDLPRPYSVPIFLPIVVLLVAVFLVLAPIIDQPEIEYLYVTLFILSGALVYVPFIHFKLFPGLFDKVTVFLQLFLEVVPVAKNL
ncbi:b(0,+)-type amino acid transporter 1-like isoform X1 [Cololabis saira]|uniref:b(0,+)-type amino acid transporter 1-like isoform X1 n=1 Tax=Cololabis saira TaxID=129043 RepID=UPI002AD48E66|nr:b(0,+)-type amino acid transporter 1-like isoform X1 [Cololabis saira]